MIFVLIWRLQRKQIRHPQNALFAIWLRDLLASSPCFHLDSKSKDKRIDQGKSHIEEEAIEKNMSVRYLMLTKRKIELRHIPSNDA